ncbi:MAG: CBS domain-containing protein [Halanaerobiaceae bacterium]
MEIIVAHNITDLDGLAAMIAASKLYQQARPVFVGRLHRMVRNFMALYRDEFEILDLKDIDLKQVTRIIVVDTYELDRLGELSTFLDQVEELPEIIVYDHHPHGPEDIPRVDLDMSQEAGSATTILINKIRAENYHLNPIEATICALGIYADTGKFTHLDTTSEDFTALSFLLESGANMKIINEFLVDELNSKQEQVFNQLQENRMNLTVEGVEVALFSLKYEKYVAGINNVTEKLKSVFNVSVIFVLVEMEGEVVVVARSSDEAVNVGRICSHLNGGGHSGAASGSLEMDLEQAEKKLIALLKKEIKPPVRVEDIMTKNVRTISPETEISRAEEIMNKYGHNGLVVCDDGEIKGIFSRRDIEKVKGHDLMHAPVKAYMSKNVIKIACGEPVNKARELMVKYNIGRLPVIKNGVLQGIVTRSDLINSYYPQTEVPFNYQNIYGNSLVEINPQITDITDKLEKMPSRVVNILKNVGEIGRDYSSRIYLIGGMVRDLLLGKENRDLDFVVEGDVEQLAEEISNFYGVKGSYNDKFETATIELEDYDLDLAATRKEYYPSPGALPEVEAADILEDLFRRDYTVNALALNILPSFWGELLDFFDGRSDLEDGKLRILHRFSFLDDPTRIIRGVRLALELDFVLETETSQLAREALTAGDFSDLSFSRVFRELKLLFRNKIGDNFISLLQKYPVFQLFDLEVEIDEQLRKKLLEVEDFLAFLENNEYNIEKCLIRIAAITGGFSDPVRDRINLSIFAESILKPHPVNLAPLELTSDYVQRVKIFESLAPEQIVLCWLQTDKNDLKKDIRSYFQEDRDLEIAIDGNLLQKLGLEQGPEIKKVLNQIKEARISGTVETREQEIKLAKKIIDHKDNQS